MLRCLSLWVCWEEVVVACCEPVLKLWVDIDINFTIKFYVNYILHSLNHNKLRIICLVFLLSSPYSVLAIHIIWLFQAWRKIFFEFFRYDERSLWIFFLMLYTWYIIKALCTRKALIFCYVSSILSYFFCLMTLCLRSWS